MEYRHWQTSNKMHLPLTTNSLEGKKIRKAKYAYSGMEEGSKLPRKLVDDVRAQVLEFATKNVEHFEGKDLQRVAMNDWTVERCILDYTTREDDPTAWPVRVLIAALKFRQTFGCNHLSADMFPREFYTTGLVLLYGRDLNGGQVMIIRANFYKRSKTWDVLYQKYLLYWLEKADRANRGGGLTVIVDMNRLELTTSFDVSFLYFFAHGLREWYPKLVTVVLFYKLPQRLLCFDIKKQIFRVMRNDKPTIFKVAMQKFKLRKYVRRSQLPDFLGGTNPEPYLTVPKNAACPYSLAERHSLNGADWAELEEWFESLHSTNKYLRQAQIIEIEGMEDNITQRSNSSVDSVQISEITESTDFADQSDTEAAAELL